MTSKGYQLVPVDRLATPPGNIWNTFGHMLGQIGQFFPAFAVLSLGTWLAACLWRDKLGLGLTLLAWCLPFFAIVEAMAGQSTIASGSLIVLIPIGFLLLIWIGWRLKANRLVLVVGLCLLGASDLCTGLVMWESPQVDGYERAFVRVLGGERWDGWIAEGALGRAIAGFKPAMRVLADDRDAYPVIYFSGRPERFIVPDDPRFAEALEHPWEIVDGILVSRPDSTGMPDYIQAAYPDLYANGAPWAQLAAEIGSWRLYWVVSEPPASAPPWTQSWPAVVTLPSWLVFILRTLVGGLLILVLLWILRRLNRQVSFPMPEERLVQSAATGSSASGVSGRWIVASDSRLASRADVFKLILLMAEWLVLLVLTFYTLFTLPFLLIVGAGMVHWLNQGVRKVN